MTLLQSYLAAVRAYLPRNADQQDILTELSAHLQIKMEEREEEIGRALTEDEQAAVLSAYGNPLVVAGRYGATNLGLSFGRQLIGPELFLLYRRILLAQFSIAVIVITIIRAVTDPPRGLLVSYLEPMLFQFLLTTSIFITIDRLKQRSQSQALWNFPPAHMQLVPRWQSMGGLITLSLTALWWASIPYAPFLLLGSSASRVALTSSFHAFYWPVIVPLLIGVAQRAATFVQPGWAFLQTIVRLITNLWAVALVYVFTRAFPYVAAQPGSGAEEAAARINSGLWWNAVSSLGLYWLINAAFLIYLLIKQLAQVRKKKRAPMSSRQVQSW